MIGNRARKDSGVAWLGAVPAEWSVKYLGSLVHVAGGCTPSKENLAFWDGSIPWVSPKDMKREVISDSEDHVTELALQRSGLRLIPDPVVLMVTRGMILDHTVPIARTAQPVTVNQDMKALRPRTGLSAEYLAHFLRAMNQALLAKVEEAGHGTKALRTDLWRKLPVAVPPPAEQCAICSFLDRKTAAIDGLIAKKERLIELLQEKRQALITQAVTRGLDPNVPMKESGVEWLDKVPTHWKVRPLKRVLAHGPKNGISPPPAAGAGVPSFSISAVRGGRVDVMSWLKEVALSAAEARAYRMRKRDLLLVRGNGNLEMVGACGLVDEFPDGCTYPDILMLMRPSQDVLPEFLVATINSPYVRAQIELAARTSNGAYKVSGEDVRSLLVAIPPIAEQQAITARVVACDQSALRLLSSVRPQTERLREYRQALITAAVTGKIDLSSETA